MSTSMPVGPSLNDHLRQWAKDGKSFIISERIGASGETTKRLILNAIPTSHQGVHLRSDTPVFPADARPDFRTLDHLTMHGADVMRTAMRMDTDVIVMDEIVNGEDVQNFLLSAETGHQVLGGNLYVEYAKDVPTRLQGALTSDRMDFFSAQMANVNPIFISHSLVPGDPSGELNQVAIWCHECRGVALWDKASMRSENQIYLLNDSHEDYDRSINVPGLVDALRPIDSRLPRLVEVPSEWTPWLDATRMAPKPGVVDYSLLMRLLFLVDQGLGMEEATLGAEKLDDSSMEAFLALRPRFRGTVSDLVDAALLVVR